MFAPDQTGRSASPHPDLQRTACGSCAVCKVHVNSSSEPRLLPCLHIICNTCLTKICTDEARKDCPLCAQSFCLSELTECTIFEDASSNNRALKCAGCEESEVSGWCVQCEEALCLDCTSAHRRVKVTRDHEVTPKKPPTGWIQRRRCPSHTQESLRYFCLICEELTCKDCQLISHRGHSFVQQEEAAGSQRQRLQSLLDSIRHQKETVSSSLVHLEARLQDIKGIKVTAKKMLTQIVHSIYQTLVVKATQMLKEIEALYEEEVGHLLERKTSLNRLEGCQDYTAAFIGKVLHKEGHCLLIHTKKIETHVKKLLSQKACTPENMIQVHIQLQNELCQQIMKCGFLRFKQMFVPFTSTQSGKSSNQNPCASFQAMQTDQPLTNLPHHSQPSQPSHSNQAATHFACSNVASSQLNQSKSSSADLQSLFSSSPSVQVQYSEVMSEQTKHAYSPSSNSVPYIPQSASKTHINSSPSVYSQPRLPFTNCTASQTHIISESAKYGKANCPTLQLSHTHILNRPMPIPVNNQTPLTTHTIPTNNQTFIPTHPVQPNNQTPLTVSPIPANSQSLTKTHSASANIHAPLLTYPMPVNNQSPLLTHQMPANNQKQPVSVNNQTPVATHPKPANSQTTGLTSPLPADNQIPLLAHQMPLTNQTPIPTHLIQSNNQTPTATHSLPTNNQIPVLIQPIPVNNQTPTATHPIPANNQIPVLIQPIPVNNQSTILTHSLPGNSPTLILTHPVQTNFLGPGHSFSVQPNIPLTILSTVNTLSLNDATAISNVFPVNPMPSAPIDGNSTLQSKIGTNNGTNLPVRALADSACDQDSGVSSTNFTDTDHLESNLPTSIVSEATHKQPSPDPGHTSGPSIIHQNSLSTTTTTETFSNKNYSGPKHWSTSMPTTFRQLVEATFIPVESKENLNTTPPVNSSPCSRSEELNWKRSTHNKTVQSTFDYRETKKEDKESAVTLEHLRRQIKQCKRYLRVSLVRLPISLPLSGQPLPEFHLTPDTSTDHILVQESQGGQVNQVWRWCGDPIPSRSSPCSVSQDSDGSSASDVEFCAVCLSAGAALLCSKCGCAFHSDCHIPPILTKPCKGWVCLLCQDVNETVMYDTEERRTPSLSLQDQRKCEKLVFGLLCDENKSLLYSAAKNHSKTAEFEIILGRLLGKRKPPYRTAAELVSDLWTLFDLLMINPEIKHMVVKLQNTFQQQLNETFGESLHASVLNNFSSKDPETETEREKHRNTLKRMREFFIANSGTAAKKSCTDKGSEGDGC